MNTKGSVKKGIIYRIDFPNGKLYIGLSTKTLKQTIARYIKECRTYKRPVNNALNKFGLENCVFSVIDELSECSLEQLCEKEIGRIKEFRSNVRGVGYNLKLGGQFGSQLHPSTKKKIGLKARERLKDKTKHPMWNKQHSQETKEKISLAHKGKVGIKLKPDLTKEQLLEWFEDGINFREAEIKYKVSQRKLEASLQTHYGTSSLEEALSKWRETLKGLQHKGLKRKFLTKEQLELAFNKGWSTRKVYKEFNTHQRALARETKWHYGTKSWDEAKRKWKESLQE